MGEPFWNRLSELLGSVIKPNHLMVLLSILSGCAVFDLFALNGKLGIAEGVQKYRFVIVLTFLITSGLLIFGLALKVYETLGPKVRFATQIYVAKRAAISEGARVVLIFIYGNRPDAVRLLSSHPVVRELRILKYIDVVGFNMSSDFVSYKLSEIGLKMASGHYRTLGFAFNDSAKLLLGEVTGNVLMGGRGPFA